MESQVNKDFKEASQIFCEKFSHDLLVKEVEHIAERLKVLQYLYI